MKDFYYILGVDANCTLNEIKDAYRKLSKKFHPDLNQGDEYFESRFREITEAYETLSDPYDRLQYDAALKKIKSNTSNGGNQKQQYYNDQATNQQYQPPPTSFARRRFKGPGIGMSVALMLIALVFGVYVVESFSNSKARKVIPETVVVAAAVKSHKHHKKKHPFKDQTSDDSVKTKTKSIIIDPVKPIPVSSKPTVPVVSKPPVATVSKPAVVNNKEPEPKGNYIYATIVKANVTGVINMRRSDDYSSPVIEKIPANSKVFVMEKGNAYYKVAYDNYVGYVPRWALETK